MLSGINVIFVNLDIVLKSKYHLFSALAFSFMCMHKLSIHQNEDNSSLYKFSYLHLRQRHARRYDAA